MADARDNQPLETRTYRRDPYAGRVGLVLGGALLAGVVGSSEAGSPFRTGNWALNVCALLIWLALAAVVAYCILEWWNGRTSITGDALDVTDWRGRQVHVPWDTILAMWMGTEAQREWLKLEVPGDGPRPQMVNLLTRRRGSEELAQLRDTIAVRARLVEIEPARDWLGRVAKRVWRRVESGS